MMPVLSLRLLLRLFLPIGFLISWRPAFSQVIDADRCDSIAHLVITPSAAFMQTELPVSLDSVLRSASRFHQPHDKAVFVANYDPYYYWFRIILNNPRAKSRDLMLLMAPLGLYDGRLFQRVDGKWTQVGQTGLRYRFPDRSYQFTHHVFPFTLPARRVDTLYFSIDASNAYKLFGFALFRPTEFRLFEGKIYFVFGIIVGLLLLFFALNISLFFALKERLHLWYALYIALLFFVVMKNDQLDQQFLGLDSERAFRLTPYAAAGALAIAVLLHVVQQFLKKVLIGNRLLYRGSTLLKINIVCSAVAHALVFLTSTDSRIENIVFEWVKISVLVCICLLIADCLYCVWKGQKSALFLFFGSFVFMVGSIQRLFVGSLSFLFPPTTFHIGIILEIFIISMALIYRYWLEREEQREKEEQVKIKTMNEISTEIHDNVGQTLALANIILQRIDHCQIPIFSEKIGKAESFIGIAIVDLRDLSRELKNEQPEVRDLVEEVKKLCLENQNAWAIETDCEIRGEVMVLDNKRRGMVLRIIKEALHNAMKHANASHVEVQLNFEGGRLFLTISDNGVGFDMATVYPKSNGLQNITNRCGLLNAACCIDSKYGEGTRIRIDLPVQ